MHDKALCKFAWVTGCGNALKYKNIILGGKVHGRGIGVTQNVKVLP